MLIFWSVSGLFFVVALLAILFPLYRKASIDTDIDQKSLNISIAKEQLLTLEVSHQKNEISQEEYDELKYELESCLMEDISGVEGAGGETSSIKATDTTEEKTDGSANTNLLKTFRPLAISLILFVPIFSSIFYQTIGNIHFVDEVAAKQVREQKQASGQQASVEQMIKGVIDKLKKDPTDEQSWFLLARTFMALKKYDEAYDVYAKLIKLKGEQADILVSMADALAMKNGGNVSGEPEKLIQKALLLEPENVTGLWLAGIAAKEGKQNDKALSYFNKLLPLLTTEPDSIKTVKGMIKELGGTVAETHIAKPVQQQLSVSEAKTVEQSQTITRIQVKITIDNALLSSLDPNLFVFIYAKATQGPPMPLAAIKAQIKDFKAGVLSAVLDDSMAMMPMMKLSQFNSVKVGARISKTGAPMRQAGDPMSEEVVVNGNPTDIISLLIK